MNINLSGSKKQGKNLNFGLNKRKKPSSNVLDDGDDDDSEKEEENAPETDTSKSRRDAVNREVEEEQKALRERAKKAMADAGKDSLYDYDAAYETMQTKKQKEEEAAKAASAEKKSRYIQDLLKQSEKRAIEREAIYERKVARDQEEEDAQADYRGKEKFVTKAYKRRLEERKKLAAEEEKQKKMDELEDVTKRTGGAAMASFYGNMNRNVALGGDNAEGKSDENDEPIVKPGVLGFLDGFESMGGGADTSRSLDDDKADHRQSSKEVVPAEAPTEKVELDPDAQNRAMRKAREEKLAKARARYFERNGMAPQ